MIKTKTDKYEDRQKQRQTKTKTEKDQVVKRWFEDCVKLKEARRK